MDKEWAKEMLEEGHKVTKDYWNYDEYLSMHSSGLIYNEEDREVNLVDYLEGGWQLFKEDGSVIDPSHYTKESYNPIEVIESVFLNICQTGFEDALSDEQKKTLLAALNSSFALKYFTRLGLKDDVMQELGKAENYTHRALNRVWKN